WATSSTVNKAMVTWHPIVRLSILCSFGRSPSNGDCLDNECRFVVPAIGGDRAGWIVNSCSLCGEREHLATVEQPDEPGLVVAGQPVKTGLGVLRHGEQPEQVLGRPTEGVRLVTPADEEASAIVHGLLPALGREAIWAAGF